MFDKVLNMPRKGNIVTKKLTDLCNWSLCIPPENIRKPLVFWCFQVVWKESSGMKWVNVYFKFHTTIADPEAVIGCVWIWKKDGCNFIIKKTLPQVFSSEFCEISKKHIFYIAPLGDCFCKPLLFDTNISNM